jgi:hypothetical protein
MLAGVSPVERAEAVVRTVRWSVAAYLALRSIGLVRCIGGILAAGTTLLELGQLADADLRASAALNSLANDRR